MDNQALSQQPYLTFFDADTAEYDVIVDQSSSAPNLKEATWGALQPLLPLIADKIGPDEFALLLEYSPLPESFLEKFEAIKEQKAQQPPPPDPEMMKVQAMQQAKQAELQMRQQEGQVQMQLDQQQAGAQMQLERQKADAQIQLERDKAAAQFELEQQKMAFEAQRQKHEMALKSSAAKHDMALKAGQTRLNMQQQASESNGESEDQGEAPDMEEMDIFGNKALADALTQMAQSISVMAQANAQSQQMMAEGVAALGSELKDAMTRPKQIVRGPDGRAIGVQ